MVNALCGSIVRSRRGLLAFIWSIISFFTLLAFITSVVYIVVSSLSTDDENNADGEEEEQQRDNSQSITSRAEGFAALWTSVLAIAISIYGIITLGWQSPGGQYYNCCNGVVHRTSPLSLGVFIGILIMFANLTMVCSVLFGEFHIRDYGGGKEKNQQYTSLAVQRSASVFSILMLFLTLFYGVFAALVYIFHGSILAEVEADIREEALTPSPEPGVKLHPGGGGYVGSPFGNISKTSTPGFQLS